MSKQRVSDGQIERLINGYKLSTDLEETMLQLALRDLRDARAEAARLSAELEGARAKHLEEAAELLREKMWVSTFDTQTVSRLIGFLLVQAEIARDALTDTEEEG
jgi:hypothetical protein